MLGLRSVQCILWMCTGCLSRDGSKDSRGSKCFPPPPPPPPPPPKNETQNFSVLEISDRRVCVHRIFLKGNYFAVLQSVHLPHEHCLIELHLTPLVDRRRTRRRWRMHGGHGRWPRSRRKLGRRSIGSNPSRQMRRRGRLCSGGGQMR